MGSSTTSARFSRPRTTAPKPTKEDYYDVNGKERAPDIYRFEVVVEQGGYVDWSLQEGPLSFDEWMARAEEENPYC